MTTNAGPHNLIASDVVRATKVTPGFIRVSIANGDFNLFTPTVFAGLNLVRQYVDDPRNGVKVFVLESANPEFFIAHLDFASLTTVPDVPGALDLVEHWPGFSRWLTTNPAVSIAKVRGRARGAGSELILAADMSFASTERARFAQIEVGFGLVPGGGGLEWLPKRVGRARALEIVLGADDFDAETAAQYGWINRALPDVELDEAVDHIARRIASFDATALATAKSAITSGVDAPSERDLRDAFGTILRLAASESGRAEGARIRARAGGSLAGAELELPQLYGPGDAA